MRLPGFPTIKPKSGTSFNTTDPAPISAYFPIVIPHKTVAFAPIEADFFIKVFKYFYLLFSETQTEVPLHL